MSRVNSTTVKRRKPTVLPADKRTRYVSTVFREATRAREQRVLRRLQRTFKNDGLALYLGAGVSASAEFPAWRLLIRDMPKQLVTRLAYGGNKTYYEENDLWPWRPETLERAVETLELAEG
jgi:hypothetical protein